MKSTCNPILYHVMTKKKSTIMVLQRIRISKLGIKNHMMVNDNARLLTVPKLFVRTVSSNQWKVSRGNAVSVLVIGEQVQMCIRDRFYSVVREVSQLAQRCVFPRRSR